MKPSPNKHHGTRLQWEERDSFSPAASFGKVIYHPRGRCGPRIQNGYQFFILYSGSCMMQVDHARRALQVGLIYLFKPGRHEDSHFSKKTQSHHAWFWIRPGVLPPTLRRALDQTPDTGLPASELFTRLFDSVFLLHAIRTPEARRVVEALGLALCAEYLRMGRTADGKKDDDPCVARALNHMENHFGEESCLSEARKISGCAANTLAYKFAKATGQTPSRYLWNLRMEKGLRLLNDTGLTISEIAYRCGFASPFHFSRLVREHQQQSPREFRQQSWSSHRLNKTADPRPD